MLQGQVTVNGQVVRTLGAKADPEKDCIRVRGKLLSFPAKVYLMLNKPKGTVTTLKDPQGRPKVTDLLKGVRERVFPVGRLDYDAEGLLLLTNDGELAHRLIHPSRQLVRVYEVKVQGSLSADELQQLRSGVKLGRLTTLPASVTVINRGISRTRLRLELREGRYRQIKRMFAALGHCVLGLRRVKFGPLGLGKLPFGQFRALTARELVQLKRAAGGR
jgi:pseudouridine synthase